tara:strand:+ start:1220 stop:1702 length:483 start_codon:yes stop_codon:yes gene_type:complete
VRKTSLIFSFFFFLACDLDFQISKKISVDEFVNDEMKSFNWSEVDQLPVFENCTQINETSKKNNCFIRTISDSLSLNFIKNDLVLNRTLIDTVFMKFKVDKKGIIEIENIEIGEKILPYKEVINQSFVKTAANLPKLYPAIKRGQEVDVTFDLPILVSTE